MFVLLVWVVQVYECALNEELLCCITWFSAANTPQRRLIDDCPTGLRDSRLRMWCNEELTMFVLLVWVVQVYECAPNEDLLIFVLLVCVVQCYEYAATKSYWRLSHWFTRFKATNAPQWRAVHLSTGLLVLALRMCRNKELLTIVPLVKRYKCAETKCYWLLFHWFAWFNLSNVTQQKAVDFCSVGLRRSALRIRRN